MTESISLGLRANWRQFALLVALTTFVGGMVGLERTVLPLLAKEDFGIASKTATISFIATFGSAKALTNLAAGHLAEHFTRRTLLIAGWLIGLPVPFLIIAAPTWYWIIGANFLLGLNQGLAWSMTVNMKMDLVGPRRRGLAMGLNEAAGYMAVGGVGLLAGLIAERYGLRPEPFYLGIGLVSAGLAMTIVAIKDTRRFVGLEAILRPESLPMTLGNSFRQVSWQRPQLFGISQAGFFNNFNDAVAWGLFPLLFASRGLSLDRIALVASLYPMLWGALQVATGWASDQLGRKRLIVGGMVLQSIAISTTALSNSFGLWLFAAAILGFGTAFAYPALLAAIGDSVNPAERALSLGVYRFWRDAGAVAGALSAAALADVAGFGVAIQYTALITMLSAFTAAFVIDGSEGCLSTELESAK